MSVKMTDALTANMVAEEVRKETKPSKAAKEIAGEALASIVERTTPIQALQQRIAQTPAVDKQKVEAMQKKLANNELEINPSKIAERILNLENDLFSDES
ncbi:MAG: hypothetical protein BGO43_02295 [Gammaproteobacteria bacterium 39-13]|nr:flagellar biosynthesis anti-sigma factor FlgM [Gammaproteobacteria bacterium]OJV88439.1 MAG: hypothetical protein BGO43_02295 [Gammaproteobacteria bacterium 39-13]